MKKLFACTKSERGKLYLGKHATKENKREFIRGDGVSWIVPNGKLGDLPYFNRLVPDVNGHPEGMVPFTLDEVEVYYER